jgi:CHAT domain-containing protein
MDVFRHLVRSLFTDQSQHLPSQSTQGVLTLFTCPLCGQMQPLQCPGFGRHSPASTLVRKGDRAQCSRCTVYLTQVNCSICSQVIYLTLEVLDDPLGSKQTTHEYAMQQMSQFSDINERTLKATYKASIGSANERVVTELKEILADCNKLLKELAPRYPACNPETVRYRIADITSWIGYAYESLRNNQEAIRYLEQAALRFGEIGQAEQVRECQEKIGRLQIESQGIFDKELSRLQAERVTLPKYSLQHVDVTIELSNVYIGAGDYFEAEKLLRAVEQELDQMENIDAHGSTMLTIPGAALNDDLTHQLQSIEVKVEKYSLYIRLYSNLARVYRDSDFEEASDCFKKAKQKETENIAYLQHYKEQMNLSDNIMKTLNSLDIILHNNKGLIFLEIQQTFNILRRDVKNFGEQRSQQHRNAVADSLLEKAQALELECRQLGILEGITTALIHRADIFMTLERYDEAIAALKSARSVLNNRWQHDRGVEVLVKLAEIYAHKKQWQDVSSLCGEGIQLVEEYRYKVTSQYMQSSYLHSRIGLYAWGARAAYELGGYGLMLERAELSKCRSVLRYQQRTLASTTDQQRIEQDFRHVCEQIDSAGTDSVLLEELLFKRRTLWDLLLIQRFQARTEKSLPEFSLEAVQSTLAADEAIVYYYWLDRYTLLIAIIDQERVIPVLRSLSPEQQTELKKLASFVLTLTFTSPVSYLDSVQDFSALLLPEEATSLLREKKRLLISPHRLLHAIPFHALQWDDAFLIQTFAVTYIPNLSSLMATYAPSQAQRILAVGISEYQVPGYPLPALRTAEQEVANLENLCRVNSIPITTLRGPEAQGDRFRRLDQGGELEKFTCLHFATHGANIESDTPMESYLFLRDEKLDGMEIANWQLHANLVVLSACSSGQRPISGRWMEELPGDELFGLQSAFFMAGARQMLGCLWPVDDKIASQLTKAFHQRLVVGEPPEFALQNSIKGFLETASFQYQDVYYWAPFFLSAMGRPTFADTQE